MIGCTYIFYELMLQMKLVTALIRSKWRIYNVPGQVRNRDIRKKRRQKGNFHALLYFKNTFKVRHE